jgi:hypothetical protein
MFEVKDFIIHSFHTDSSTPDTISQNIFYNHLYLSIFSFHIPIFQAVDYCYTVIMYFKAHF